ncbi:MAG: class I SAM-dependent methyltransferase [Chloroflexi bacterium]|nr:class I SAM-dependent methyltransferase [Chloroflexota bacterium]
MLDELRRIAATVGERKGWDFSQMRDAREPTPWDYVDVVRQYLRSGDKVLDMGTGGGEKLLSLASHFGQGVGTDIDPMMVETARENVPASLKDRVSFLVMANEALQFPDCSFDVVLDRHSTICVSESARVLRPDGYFITQQVGKYNTRSIFTAFGWDWRSFGPGWWVDLLELARNFERADCTVIVQAEYDVRYWIEDVESLMFWLKAVPLPEVFDIERHWECVAGLLQNCRTGMGIETNEHRILLIARRNG